MEKKRSKGRVRVNEGKIIRNSSVLLRKTLKLPEVIRQHKIIKQVDKQIKRKGKCFKPMSRQQVEQHENQSLG